MPSWLTELLVMLAFLPPTAPAALPLDVPATPLVTGVAATGPREVFVDHFDAPYAERWSHVSSSAPERVTQGTVDDRSVLQVGPEGHVSSLDPVPFEVGTTYRVTASLKMPAETGFHPAFWLRTADLQRAGEIDVVESWGGEERCGRVQVAYYWRYSPPIGDVQCVGEDYPAPDEWHEYAVEFTYMGPGQDAATQTDHPTRFFVDGRETWSTPHAPVAPEHLRLQVKRNCPDEEQPSCGAPALVPGTDPGGPLMYVDYVKVDVVSRQPVSGAADLFALKQPPTGGVEAHVLDAATGYTAFANQTGLALPEQGWRFTTGDFDGDLVDDVYASEPAGRGAASVKVLDGGDYLHSFLTHASVVRRGTRFAQDDMLAGDYDDNGRDDLYLVDRDDAGHTSIAVLDATTGFQTDLVAAPTAAPALDPQRWKITTGDYNFDGRDDLYLVDTDSAGVAAVHVLDAATGFTTYLAQTPTVAPAFDGATWSVSTTDHNGDGRDDLALVDRDADGATVVHVLDAATGFTTFLAQVATPLGATSDPTWTIPDS